MVRTRFAPSPTGYLHIGGVRTALFNWLFARHHGGAFLLRIDDTDVERNLDEALAPILAGFRWLGIDWDEGPEAGGDHGPYLQSEKLERYQAVAAALIERGAAYRDFATPEEIQAERSAAETAGERFVYSRRWAATTDEDRERFEAEGRRGVVRLRMPREGQCRFTDRVRGDVAFDWAGEQDHVVLRADGNPLYHLASVVDDHDMEITHVIRAEEHLSNTARQIFIAEAMGWKPPEWAHLPFVAEPGSRNKLSKRKLDKYLKHADFAALAARGESIAEAIGAEPDASTFNPVLVGFYETIGFLPDALLNYLLLLGWSLDDKTEEFTRPEMIEHFSLERVNRSPASFDPQKLLAFQGRHMFQLSAEERTAACLPFAERAGLFRATGATAGERRVRQIVEAAGDRIVLAGDILEYGDFFAVDAELAYDEAAFDKRLRRPEGATALLAELRGELADLEPFTTEAVEGAMRGFCEAREIKLGAIVHAVRVAVTGKAVGFGLFESLEILGRESCLARIDRALERVDD